MKRRLVVLLVLVMVLALAMAVPALAKTDAVQGKLVLNITDKITNSWVTTGAPEGIVWALTERNSHLQVWRTGADSFYLVTTYEGRWHTLAGVPSPGEGIPQGHDGSGPFHGRLEATFTSPSVNPDNWPMRGFIGTFDEGATLDDLGQWRFLFPPNVFSVTTYFPELSGFTIVYHEEHYLYRGQSWVRSLVNGNSGDIQIP